MSANSSAAPEGGDVMVQPDRQERQLGAPPETARSLPARYKVLAAARDRFEGSLAQSFLIRLKALDFADQAMLFGAGLLASLLPFVILLSAFASHRVDDDISLRLGLDRRAAGIVDHLFTAAPATLNFATATSLVFLVAGMLAVASSLQQIYEKVFRQDHRRDIRDLYRLVTWIAVLGALLPAAVITGVFYGGLGLFSKFYFSDTIISDSKTYGTIGAIFSIMTWFIAIGAVIILGAVAGAVWAERNTRMTLFTFLLLVRIEVVG
jgi:uncharacterized BrkB/YihY/UPF0761 family membrane protein